MPAVCASCSLSPCACLSVYCLLFYQMIIFSSELKIMRGDTDQVADVRNRRASISLPINLLKTVKINNTSFGCIGMPWDRFDLVRFSYDAFFPRSCFLLNSRRSTLISKHRS